MQWGTTGFAYFYSAIACEDFKARNIDGFAGRQAPDASHAGAISLRRGSDVSIRNSKADPGTKTFLSGDEVSGERIFSGNDLRNAERGFEGNTTPFESYGNYLPAHAAQ